MSVSRRPFRIEASDRMTSIVEPAGSGPIGIGLDGQLDRILNELEQVRTEISKFKERDPTVDRERDRNALWAGIETIQDAIRSTKREIATLHSEGTRGENLFTATDELDHVVQDTEDATEVILSAAETIDNAVATLAARLSGEDLTLAEEVQAQIIRIFEACNFQDITGQRIKKVVKLMVFIEERVTRMTDIWGGADMVAQNSGITQREGDEKLLNGPALATDENVVSQDDIDSLFA